MATCNCCWKSTRTVSLVSLVASSAYFWDRTVAAMHASGVLSTTEALRSRCIAQSERRYCARHCVQLGSRWTAFLAHGCERSTDLSRCVTYQAMHESSSVMATSTKTFQWTESCDTPYGGAWTWLSGRRRRKPLICYGPRVSHTISATMTVTAVVWA